MKRLDHLLFTLILLLAQEMVSATGLNEIKSTTWVSFNELAPTQMSIGEYAMLEKVRILKKKAKSKQLRKYLLTKIAPAFLASNGKFYITDRHHTSRAAYEVYKQGDSSLESYPINIDNSYRHLPMGDFFEALKNKGELYLYLRGQLQEVSDLPILITDMKEDAYRSLAWMVREKGGFKKVNVSFLEFIWADFLRSRISIGHGLPSDLHAALPVALKACHSLDASHLPGFH